MPSTLTKRALGAAMAAALTLGVGACGDDDDELINDEQQQDINEGGEELEQDLEDTGEDVQEGIEDGVDELDGEDEG